MRNRKQSLILAGISLILLIPIGFWLAGSLLCAPYRKKVGQLPTDLNGRAVEFQSRSGATLRGWFLPGRAHHGALLLLHGVHATRLNMLGRARFLNQAGYGVLLFDFQAHGESTGEAISFGFRESQDAQAALNLLKTLAPGERTGVIGCSMGGAAAVLATPKLETDAMVIEMAYPDIEQAVTNRVTMRLGGWAAILVPGLTCQLEPRLGIGPRDLRPIQRIGDITVPKFIIAGTNDRHTTLAESKKLFQAAPEPKTFWAVNGAAHVDLHSFCQAEYEQKVLNFLAPKLSTQAQVAVARP